MHFITLQFLLTTIVFWLLRVRVLVVEYCVLSAYINLSQRTTMPYLYLQFAYHFVPTISTIFLAFLGQLSLKYAQVCPA